MRRHTLTALALPNTNNYTTTTTNNNMMLTINSSSPTPVVYDSSHKNGSSLNSTTNTAHRKNALPFLKDISPTLPLFQQQQQQQTQPQFTTKGKMPQSRLSVNDIMESLAVSSLQSMNCIANSSTSTTPPQSSSIGYTSTKVVRISSQQQHPQQSSMTQSNDSITNRNRRSSSMSSTMSKNSTMTTSTTTSNGSSMSESGMMSGSQSSITKKRKTRCCRSIDRIEISRYFSIKEEEAAKEMNISKSKLKRVKKEMGISRWPYRRLEALNQELKEVQDLMKKQDMTDVAATETMETPNQVNNVSQLCQQEKILQKSIDLIYQMPNIIVNQSNDNIKEICFKTQRISLSNLLNL